MVAQSAFPYPEEDVGTEEAPRVGDGVVVVDADGAGGQVIPALGAATAQYLHATLTGGEVLGVSSWSATLLAAARVPPGDQGAQCARRADHRDPYPAATHVDAE